MKYKTDDSKATVIISASTYLYTSSSNRMEFPTEDEADEYLKDNEYEYDYN